MWTNGWTDPVFLACFDNKKIAIKGFEYYRSQRFAVVA